MNEPGRAPPPPEWDGRFFELSLDLLCVATLEGYFLHLNPAWERVLGLSRSELMSRPFVEFVHPDDVAGTLAAAAGLGEGDVVISFENRYRTAAGGWRWISWNSTADVEAGLIYAVARDITERKELERVKDELISVVSHELRTPLTSIRGALGLVLGGALGGVEPRVERLLRIAAENGERLVRLVNDMLDIQKIESGRLELRSQSLPVESVVRRALGAFASYAQTFEVHVTLTSDTPDVMVRADPDALAQILDNLMSNAAKFSAPGGAIRVDVTRRDESVRISVADDGQGIPAAFQDHVFERFAQADTSTSRDKGGLGLSICKALVERHGGSIGFDSEVGRGTTFWFDLPVFANLVATNPDPGTVLVVEDEPAIVEVLRRVLEGAGHRVDVALDAESAIEKLRGGNEYSALTLDLRLPGRDGLSLFRELRRDPDPRLRDLPVVVVSASAREGDGEHAVNGSALAVVGWLDKPIDQDLLIEAIDRAVRSRPAAERRILHVEDDADLAHIMHAALAGMGEVTAVGTCAGARAALADTHYDVVVLDLELQDGNAAELLADLQSGDDAPRVIVFSGAAPDPNIAGRVHAAFTKSRHTIGDVATLVGALLR